MFLDLKANNLKKINAKQKGNRFEREVCIMIREHGYTAVTARYVNQKLDEMGVDIVTDYPLQIQCKHQERLKPNLHEILKAMPETTFSEKCVVHKKNGESPLITMKFEDFLNYWERKE